MKVVELQNNKVMCAWNGYGIVTTADKLSLGLNSFDIQHLRHSEFLLHGKVNIKFILGNTVVGRMFRMNTKSDSEHIGIIHAPVDFLILRLKKELIRVDNFAINESWSISVFNRNEFRKLIESKDFVI